MTTRLTVDQRQAVDQHHGFLEVDGGGAVYVVMSMQAFREMMGIGSDAAYQAPLEAVREGLADVEGGRTQPIGDFFQDLARSIPTALSFPAAWYATSRRRSSTWRLCVSNCAPLAGMPTVTPWRVGDEPECSPLLPKMRWRRPTCGKFSMERIASCTRSAEKRFLSSPFAMVQGCS